MRSLRIDKLWCCLIYKLTPVVANVFSKMQRLVLIFALASGALALSYIGNHLKKHITHAKIHEAFQNKYIGNSSTSTCKNFDTEMENATSLTIACFNNSFDSEKLSFCHFVEKGLRKCLDGPRLLLNRCVPPKSTGLPDLVLNMLYAFLDFTCKAKGSQLIELTNPCVTLTLNDYTPNLCGDKLNDQAMKLMGPEMCLSKSGLCELARGFKTCLNTLFNEYCTSPITKANFFKFYDTILLPCKKEGI